jgi:hypothetical protein
MVTVDELKAWLAATILFLVAVVLTGCATIRANIETQAKWQRMADEVTTANHVAPIPVRLVDGLNGQYRCRENVIALGTDATPWLLAHEIGHYVLAHGCTESLATEEAANSFAVQAMQVWGYSERDAVTRTVRILIDAQRRHVSIPAHAWCQEADDVLRRYPTPGVVLDGPCSTAAR